MANFCTLSLNIATLWSDSTICQPCKQGDKTRFLGWALSIPVPHAVSILHSAFFHRPLPAKEMIPWWSHFRLCTFFFFRCRRLPPPSCSAARRQTHQAAEVSSKYTSLIKLYCNITPLVQIPFGVDEQQEQGKSSTQAKPSSLPHKQDFHWI